MIRHLQLVLPDALPCVRRQTELTPTLQEWLTSGVRTPLWAADDAMHARLEPWQHSLLHALPEAERTTGFASAALSWRGEGAALEGYSYLHATPVHLAAGLDDLRLLLPPAPTLEHSQLLLQSLQPLLALSGYELLMPEYSNAWYLRTPRVLELDSYAPRHLLSARVHELMITGADAGGLRRLMTEMQMLLHEHPVNQQRARHGLPAINAVWLWGHAPLQGEATAPAMRVMGEASYLRGLSAQLQMQHWPMPQSARELLAVDTEQLLLLLPGAITDLETHWLEPLHAALLRGAIGMLDIHADNWRIRLRGGRWQRWQRRLLASSSPLAELLN
jgi:hypothetical protein